MSEYTVEKVIFEIDEVMGSAKKWNPYVLLSGVSPLIWYFDTEEKGGIREGDPGFKAEFKENPSKNQLK